MRTLIGCLVVAVVVQAGGFARAEQQPRLVIPEPVFDFGAVERGAQVEHVFVIRNGGDADLRIDNVKSSCGCTVGVASSRDIPPGGEGRITVTLDTARMAGARIKTVTLYTNDPDVPAAGLSLSGHVEVDLVITPDPVYLGRLRRGENGHRDVLVSPGRPDGTATVVAVEHEGRAVRARLATRTDGAPGQRIEVEVDPDLPIGRFNEQLVLRTTSTREPTMVLPVFGSVEGDVAVVPPQVTFGVARDGSAPERELLIHNRGARPLTVTRIEAPARIVSYDLRAVEDGQEYRLTLRLRDGVPPGKIEDRIEIFTDHPDEERIVVPLYAIVRDGRRRG